MEYIFIGGKKSLDGLIEIKAKFHSFNTFALHRRFELAKLIPYLDLVASAKFMSSDFLSSNIYGVSLLTSIMLRTR